MTAGRSTTTAAAMHLNLHLPATRMPGFSLLSVPRKALSLVRQVARSSCFILCERLLPARRNYWCFCTWPGAYAHTLDNPRAVFEEVKNDPAIVKVILRKPGQVRSSAVVEGVKVIVADAESIRGAYYLAVSRVVLLGYSLGSMASYSERLTTKHKIIQLWHGIPLKKIGRLFPAERWWEKETHKYSATVCSAERDKEIMAGAFAPVNREYVWLSGLPRNDTILKDEDKLPEDYRRQLAGLRARLAGRRLVLYAPTWREKADGIYAFSSAELAELEAILKRNNAVFGIRGHANVRASSEGREAASDSILFINDLPDVNVVLRATEVLVTDYSSIYIDFLLTGRPILHFTYDMADYVKERGFLYSLQDALAGPAIGTFSELATRLDETLGRGVVDRDQYGRAKALFHSHGNSPSAAVADRIRALARA